MRLHIIYMYIQKYWFGRDARNQIVLCWLILRAAGGHEHELWLWGGHTYFAYGHHNIAARRLDALIYMYIYSARVGRVHQTTRSRVDALIVYDAKHVFCAPTLRRYVRAKNACSFCFLAYYDKMDEFHVRMCAWSVKKYVFCLFQTFYWNVISHL